MMISDSHIKSTRSGLSGPLFHPLILTKTLTLIGALFIRGTQSSSSQRSDTATTTTRSTVHECAPPPPPPPEFPTAPPPTPRMSTNTFDCNPAPTYLSTCCSLRPLLTCLPRSTGRPDHLRIQRPVPLPQDCLFSSR